MALNTIAIVPVIAPYSASGLVKSMSKTCSANNGGAVEAWFFGDPLQPLG